MEKINTAIISNVRKLRCAYRILFEHDSQSPARIVLEGPSIETVGSQLFYPDEIALLLIDYRIVYKDSRLFFSFTHDYFPDTPIVLLVEKEQFSASQRCRHDIDAILVIDSDPSNMFSLIRGIPICPSLM
ncbi:hypothetical protein [Sphingobacterium sp. HMA12]|uniref:hypothetical protein n=1 Tax=Sphingobacterium sp. HMA12 TaxID=2050894 RepID=UPI0013151D85|nr:hypothetical protein [Sphingobacterium sp. HMA12]